MAPFPFMCADGTIRISKFLMIVPADVECTSLIYQCALLLFHQRQKIDKDRPAIAGDTGVLGMNFVFGDHAMRN